MIAREVRLAGGPAYALEYRDGTRRVEGTGPCSFTLALRNEAQYRWFLKASACQTARAFIRGEFETRGDLTAAVQWKALLGPRRSWREALAAALLRMWPQRRSDGENIRYHYDRSNEFYETFLDSSMQYSEAHYQDPAWPLEQAQQAKLDRLCRKLDLRSGDRFLDIGCGWGSLAMFAARKYEVQATGCTLSRRQFEYAVEAAAHRGLSRRVAFYEADYREMPGVYDKISSIGMYEHVGRRRMPEYFRTTARLLADRGLFLNSGITRPENVTESAESVLLARRVFPGGELPHLSEVLRAAEQAGFEAIDLEDARLHYALTCRDWVARLERNAETCLKHVDAETHRLWRLQLAASAASFEEGAMGCYRILMRRRTAQPPLRRA